MMPVRSVGRTRSGSGWNGLASVVHRLMVRSEFEGGVRLGGLGDGCRVVVRTANRLYELHVRDGETWICGHPEYCPRPVPVQVRGSSWGGSMLKVGYIGCGMCLEFRHPTFETVTTSRIMSVQLD